MPLLPFSSQLISDVGISFGDEGKGRLIPELVHELLRSSAPVSVVLKVNGGANSGHTAGGQKFNLLPCAVVTPEVQHLCVGAGVVADPRKFWWEGREKEHKGFSVFARLLIDERTMVSDLTHRLLDLAWEDYRVSILRAEPRGATGRGITPAYLEEAGQFQIYYADFLAGKDAFAQKLRSRADRAVRTIQHVCQISAETWSGFFDKLTAAELRAHGETLEAGIFQRDEFDFTQFRGSAAFTLNVDRLIDVYWEAGSRLVPHIGEVRELILREMRRGRTIVGEFGQAYWLDKRHGFSPNVTASHTYSPEFFESAGIPLQPIHTFGVAKAYDTKVGTHTFITQMEEGHPLTAKLKKLEFGSTTGRQRMVGWFDAVEKGDALRYGGFHDLMINKADALTHEGDWRGDLQICIGYEDASGRRYSHVPRNEALRKTLRPVYTRHSGWTEDISHVRSFAQLPAKARSYVAAMMRSIVDCAYQGETWPQKLPNLRYLGVGPEPSQIIKDVPPTSELVKLG
ncbi:adenylosuccinate synthase [Opitutaceae bacterium EW11]|nr:adenylosuccinate synthase [Opitutaceae bacterium EW11]